MRRSPRRLRGTGSRSVRRTFFSNLHAGRGLAAAGTAACATTGTAAGTAACATAAAATAVVFDHDIGVALMAIIDAPGGHQVATSTIFPVHHTARGLRALRRKGVEHEASTCKDAHPEENGDRGFLVDRHAVYLSR